jgi:hypothetical protein
MVPYIIASTELDGKPVTVSYTSLSDVNMVGALAKVI